MSPVESGKLARGIAIFGHAVFLERTQGLPQAKAYEAAAAKVDAAFHRKERQAKLNKDKAEEEQRLAKAKLATGVRRTPSNA